MARLKATEHPRAIPATHALENLRYEATIAAYAMEAGAGCMLRAAGSDPSGDPGPYPVSLAASFWFDVIHEHAERLRKMASKPLPEGV